MLEGQRVRLVLERVTTELKGTVIVVRGLVAEESETILQIDGRLYQQMLDESGDVIERPIGAENKMFLIPVGSIRYGEIILPGTAEEELDQKIRLLKPLGKGEIVRKGGLA